MTRQQLMDLRHMERWPKLCAAWERAIKGTWKPKEVGFVSPEAYWRWWLDRDAKMDTNTDPVLFEDNPEAGSPGR